MRSFSERKKGTNELAGVAVFPPAIFQHSLLILAAFRSLGLEIRAIKGLATFWATKNGNISEKQQKCEMYSQKRLGASTPTVE